jgi:hypothetical protein
MSRSGRRITLSLRTLMGIIIYISVILAGLSNPTRISASILFTLTVTCLLSLSLAAIISSNAPLRGFVLFCWGYLFLWIPSARVPMPITQPIATELFIHFDNGKLDARWCPGTIEH